MNNLAPEIILSIFENAATNSLRDVFALSSATRSARAVYLRFELHLLTIFADRFIPKSVQIPCRLLTALPKGILVSSRNVEECPPVGRCFCNQEYTAPMRAWEALTALVDKLIEELKQSSSSFLPTNINELRSMVRNHAKMREIYSCVSRARVDEREGTFREVPELLTYETGVEELYLGGKSPPEPQQCSAEDESFHRMRFELIKDWKLKPGFSPQERLDKWEEFYNFFMVLRMAITSLGVLFDHRPLKDKITELYSFYSDSPKDIADMNYPLEINFDTTYQRYRELVDAPHDSDEQKRIEAARANADYTTWYDLHDYAHGLYNLDYRYWLLKSRPLPRAEREADREKRFGDLRSHGSQHYPREDGIPFHFKLVWPHIDLPDSSSFPIPQDSVTRAHGWT